MKMSDTKGFFQLLFLGAGVMVVFMLIVYMPTMGFEELSDVSEGQLIWELVGDRIAPLMVVIFFLGFAAYVVTHR